LRDAKAATHRVFDPATKQLIEVPDHKTRLAAVTLELAYTEGRPFERQLTVNASSDDFAAMVDKYRHVLAGQSLQRTVPEPASDEKAK